MLNAKERTELRQRLVEVSRTRSLSGDLREWAHELLAETTRAEAAGTEAAGTEVEADSDPYYLHNVAAFVATLDDTADSRDLASGLAVAAAGAFERALEADKDDLALAHGLAVAARAADVGSNVATALVSALERPHSGDRLASAVARAIAARGGDSENPESSRAAERVLERLDAILAREPERETLATARLELLLDLARSGPLARRLASYERLAVLFADAEAAFGPSPDRDLLRLDAAAVRLSDRDLKCSTKDSSEALRLAELAAEGDLGRRLRGTGPGAPARSVVDIVMSLQRGFGRRKWLNGNTARRLASVWQRISARLPGNADALAAATEALEQSGDIQSLIDHHIERVRTGSSTDDTRGVLARHWFGRVDAGEPSGLPREVEAWVLDGLTAELARGVTVDSGLVLARTVSDGHGALPAAELLERVLLKVKGLGKSPELVLMAVHRLADAGEPERALDVGHARLEGLGDGARSAVLRLTLAKIHLGSGINIADAEPLLRGVAAEGGTLGAEARALREELLASPDFEAARRQAMLDVEARLGVGHKKPIRCRVIHGSDKFVLAEMPAVRAPGSYPHWYLRVMIRDQDLPQGQAVASLARGTELTAVVRGEDDWKSDRVRVYWVDGPVVIMARPPEDDGKGRGKSRPDVHDEDVESPKTERSPKSERGAKKDGRGQKANQDGEDGGAKRDGGREERPPRAERPPREPDPEPPTPEVEAAFNVGTETPALVRIDILHRKSQVLFGRVLPPDESDGDVFPIRVGIKAKFVPDGVDPESLAGAVVKAKIGRGPGDRLRYDGFGPIEIVSLGLAPRAGAEDAVAADAEPSDSHSPDVGEALDG